MSEFKALAANIATSNPETHAAKAPLSIRPITTHVNIVVAGSTHHVGKVPYYKLEAKVQESAVDNAKQHSQAEDDTRYRQVHEWAPASKQHAYVHAWKMLSQCKLYDACSCPILYETAMTWDSTGSCQTTCSRKYTYALLHNVR